MASSTPGIEHALFMVHVPHYAEEYALAVNPGHPLTGGFDPVRFAADRALFLERVDTPAKLAMVIEALAGDRGRDARPLAALDRGH
jgi:hypothetical protein